jgi:hypothetical protein
MNINFILKQDTEPKNRGFVVHECRAIIDNEEVAYLKATLVPSENFKRLYKSIVDFQYKLGGMCFLHFCGELLNEMSVHDIFSNEEIVNYYNESGYGCYNKVNSFNELINLFYCKYGKSFKQFKNCQVDNPYVDFSYVKEPFRRKGIGERLYLETSNFMKELGYKGLRQSTLQSNDAKAFWESLKKKGLAKKLNIQPKQRWSKKEIFYIG